MWYNLDKLVPELSETLTQYTTLIVLTSTLKLTSQASQSTSRVYY